ncbi:mannose receptor C type 1-like protein [Aphelenchoides avenae]|nr:mannose receptor C type 1-like protein [Aphelenchus avenae]
MKVYHLVITFAILHIKIVASLCPPGSIEGLAANECYVFDEKASTWTKAETECKQLGGHLASITNGFANAFLEKEASRSASQTFWIGGQFDVTKSQWTWSDSDRWSYTAWAKGQPVNANPSCLLLNTTAGATRSWFSANCDQPYSYICKVAPTTLSPQCPAGWFSVPSSKLCYILLASEPTDWSTALDVCRYEHELSLDGGNLASITSAQMNREIVEEVHKVSELAYFWIGASRYFASNITWSDGSPFAYSNWDQDEPGDGDCVAVDTDGRWFTEDWDTNYPFLCEKAFNGTSA